MKTTLVAISAGAILIYLSFQGIEIGSKPYWIVSVLITLHGAICGWGRK
jgi:hypothetical protein